ncbi:TPA: hypothetical protein N0F65_000241 [Lagenidium giganteum]|uniref:Cystinosin n=1 Tax=Lagenidium giganteum TaxID=4803 RepID=A0AAV2YGA3_9STRA|nr:TPA: hypothetical protein N0F65_000241 [Lagenidium giganteum]
MELSVRARVWLGSAMILIVGLVLGLSLDANAHIPKPWNRVSSIIGWIYFCCWSVSFYPQVFLNYQRKSVVGLSLDYTVLNLLGFTCYSIFNCAFYYSSSVQEQYMRRHGGNRNAVEVNDVFFSLHAALLVGVSLFQCWIYPRGGQTVSKGTISWTAGAVVLATLFGFAVLVTGNDESSVINTLNWLYLLSYVKLITTLFKCIPQIVLNYRRKSTVGWTIWNVLLDIVGGLLSIGRQILDSAATHDWTAITGDPVKFSLGFVSIVVDIVFVTQHYILYADNNAMMEREEKLPLLAQWRFRAQMRASSTRRAWAVGGIAVLVISLVLGFSLDANAHVPAPWNRVSSVIGWVYFTCWSLSDYPQVLLNYSRKSTVGLAVDYAALNFVGCTCYIVYNTAFYWSTSVRDQYMRRDAGQKSAVELNDFVYALHDVVLASVLLSQCFWYPHGSDSLSTPARSYIVGVASVSVLFIAMVAWTGNNEASSVNTLNWLYLLSMGKVMSTVVMSMPQIYLNYSRKSTVGWNISGIVLDMLGGFFSIVQQVLDCAATNDWTAISGDPIKFGLGTVSIALDLVFIVQHVFLYGEHLHEVHPTATSERLPLLAAHPLPAKYATIHVMDPDEIQVVKHDVIRPQAHAPVIGWVYFTCWSLSDYPQVLLNYSRKSTVGLAVDYAALNFVGCTCYIVYNTAFYWSTSVRDQYMRRDAGQKSAVELNDFVYALHDVVLASVLLSQCFWYPHGSDSLSTPARSYIVGVASVSVLFIAMVAWTGNNEASSVNTLNWLYLLSLGKVLSTVFMCVPQIYLNYSRKSTAGWNIAGVVLDMLGGFFSIVQQVLDSAATNDWTAIAGDPIKFSLGVVSVLLDLVFTVQHVFLYGDHLHEVHPSGTSEMLPLVESTSVLPPTYSAHQEVSVIKHDLSIAQAHAPSRIVPRASAEHAKQVSVTHTDSVRFTPRPTCDGMGRQDVIVSALIVTISLVLGFALDANDHVPAPWNRVSSILGWIYFCCWSVSDYPQVLLNYSRKSVEGLSLDYMALSMLGGSCYLIFNCAFFFSDSVRSQYMRHDDGHKNAVELNDVISSIHGTILSIITIFQCWWYPCGDQVVSRGTKLWVVGVIGVATVMGLIVAITGNDDSSYWTTLNWLYALSWMKIVTTLVMCVPQVMLNYQRKSTIGWTIEGVTLDLAGGVLSVTQQMLDSAATDDWTAITGDPVKFTLGLVSIAFDIVFVVQHYVLYADNNRRASQLLSALHLMPMTIVFGWLYFSCWSISDYPQVLTNYRRQSVEGLSLDLIALRMLGNTCYVIFNSAFFWSVSVREQYMRRDNGNKNAVELNDVIMSIHSVLIGLVLAYQCFALPAGDQRISKVTKAWSVGVIGVAVAFGLAVVISGNDESTIFTTLNWLYVLSWMKIVTTLVKMTPQVLLNYRRRSTVGWSIMSVLLDFAGSVLSIAQQVLDAAATDDWSAITGDPVKFALGVISLGFGVIFLLQHYVFFASSNSTVKRNEKSPLLQARDDGDAAKPMHARP